MRAYYVAVACLTAVVALNPPRAPAAAPTGLPKFEVIEQAVHAHFATLSDHEMGDLIARSQAKAALDKLTKLGWKVPSDTELLQRVLADDDFLVVELQSSGGRKFMHQISKYPNAYDRLDNLAKLPRGQAKVRELIKTKDGYKMVEYLTSTSGGKNMGKMLSAAPNGAGFNKPTGRIYTVDSLVGALRELHGKTANSP